MPKDGSISCTEVTSQNRVGPRSFVQAGGPKSISARKAGDRASRNRVEVLQRSSAPAEKQRSRYRTFPNRDAATGLPVPFGEKAACQDTASEYETWRIRADSLRSIPRCVRTPFC